MQQLADMERRRLQEQMATVLAQSHRNGSTDQRCGSAIGRFVLARKLKLAVYHAADEYGGLVRRWRAARGIASEVRDWAGGSGEGPSDATVRGWRARIDTLDAAIERASSARYLAAVQRLVLEDREIDAPNHYGTVLALMALAVETGWLSARESPY